MSKTGPVVILEDDPDDRELLAEVFEKLEIANKLIWFTTADVAFDYLKTTPEQPFIILSDVNLPGENGIEFKRRIDHDDELRRKSIPFIFYSTSVDQEAINEAYMKLTVQGFFQKPDKLSETEKRLRVIIDYWKDCRHPNSD